VRGATGYGGGVDEEQAIASARRIIEASPTRVHFSHDHSIRADCG